MALETYTAYTTVLAEDISYFQRKSKVILTATFHMPIFIVRSFFFFFFFWGNKRLQLGKFFFDKISCQ
jgi:hypothetical protein